MKTELEENNIDITPPAELKRIQRKESNDKIEFYKKRIEFSLVSTAYFLLLGVVILLNTEIITPFFSIVPFIITVVFAIRAEVIPN